MKVVFLGTPQFSVPSLEILPTIKDIDIRCVVTHPDKPKGRNLVVVPPPVRITAEKLGLPVFQPPKVSAVESVDKLKNMGIDLIVVVSFGEILSKELLLVPKLGCINLHTSILPKYRGAAPVSWALMNGEKKTGITTFWIAEKMDSGDIIMKKEVEISPSDNRGTLENKLSIEGAGLLKNTIEAIMDASAPRIPQDHSKMTLAPKIGKKDGLLDWGQTAFVIHNKIRAMNPWPVAFTFYNGIRVEIWESCVTDNVGGAIPGAVVALDKNGIGVSTGGGVLIIKELQAEGKKRVKAVDFINGYRLKVGEAFGEK